MKITEFIDSQKPKEMKIIKQYYIDHVSVGIELGLPHIIKVAQKKDYIHLEYGAALELAHHIIEVSAKQPSENILKELPQDVVARFFREAQEMSMREYNRIESKFCEAVIKEKSDAYWAVERAKDSFNSMVLAYSEKIKELTEIIQKRAK
jgi:hypothetical protein